MFLRLMGWPVELCNCCGLVETSVRLHNRFVCAVCRAQCYLPYDNDHCTIFNTPEEDGEEAPPAEP